MPLTVVAVWREPNGAHFTEPQALAAFEKPLFPLTRLAPAAQIWNKVSAIGRKPSGEVRENAISRAIHWYRFKKNLRQGTCFSLAARIYWYSGLRGACYAASSVMIFF